jgi:putative spermidine/putrescine transport system permease protein
MAPRRTLVFWLQLGFTVAVSAFLIVPVGLSIVAGLTANCFVGVESGLTLQWLVQVWNDYRHTVFLSIQIALACLVCTLLLGVPAAYVLARRQSALTRTIEELLVMPVAIPGLATALALIVMYGGWGEFRRSWVFILVGHVLFTLPFMVRSVLAVLTSIDLKTLEEGARSLGASFGQRFFGIVLPNCRGGILAGSLMVVTLSLGEFNMTLLLHTPLTQTLPVGLADAYASLRLEVGSAYTLVFFVIIVPLLMAMQWAVEWSAAPARRGRTTRQTDQAAAVRPLAAPDRGRGMLVRRPEGSR